MMDRESVLCIKSVRFFTSGGDSDAMDISESEQDQSGSSEGDWYFVVGTSIAAIPNPQDVANNIAPEEDKEVCLFDLKFQGRILVFTLTGTGTGQRKLNHISSLTVAGSVHDLAYVDLHGGRLIAGISSTVQALKWDRHSLTLTSSVSYTGLVACITLHVSGTLISAGDLMNSVTMLAFQCIDGVDDLVMSAVDKSTVWMAALGQIDDKLVCADGNYNLMTLERGQDVVGDSVGRLEVTGRYHLGDYVNRFRQGMEKKLILVGSLVMNISKGKGSIATPRLLFCTVNGAIGVVSTIDCNSALLEVLQERMRDVVKGRGVDLDHEQWRAWKNDRQIIASSGFIDGDLVERFLELDEGERERVCEGLEYENEDGEIAGLSVGKLCEIVDGLVRLH
jgi:DNA damage-binding protein 1